jgi:hypothetical protein
MLRKSKKMHHKIFQSIKFIKKIGMEFFGDLLLSENVLYTLVGIKFPLLLSIDGRYHISNSF